MIGEKFIVRFSNELNKFKKKNLLKTLSILSLLSGNIAIFLF